MVAVWLVLLLVILMMAGGVVSMINVTLVWFRFPAESFANANKVLLPSLKFLEVGVV